MSWEPELEELRRREALAREMGGEERVARQHASGRLTVRERIERLFDAGTFHETGALAGIGAYDEDGELTGFTPGEHGRAARARSRAARAVVQGDDFTVRGGAADAAIWQKMVYAERLAHDLRLPLVRLVDGTGGGGSVKSLETMGFTYVPFVPGLELAVANLARVPVVAAALGPVAGLGAARVVASHFSRDRARHRAAVRRRPAGGGRGDGRVARQGGARRLARRRRAPARSTTRPPTRTTRSRSSGASSPTCRRTCGSCRRSSRRTDPADRREEELLSIVPRDPRKPYEMRAILEAVFDRGSVFELGARYGRSLITRARAARRAARSACWPPTPSTTAAG